MKIVHTSDWHAGRIWKNVNRLDELESCLDQLASYIENESADLLLVTGDVFDSGAPAARAERVVFQFFKRVGSTGAHTIVIAGNHDSADRFEAWGALTELVNVRALGRPKAAKEGGVIDLVTRSGEKAVVAAVPFAAQSRLVSALELSEGDDRAMQTYADRMRQLIERLCRSFRNDAVNLLCLHTHLEGAIKGGSERQVHLGEDWAAMPAHLPANAHYIALGHLHRPQRINAPAPAYYAGSPLQMDFGECGEQKSFVVIDAKPVPQPVTISTIPYTGGIPLKTFRGKLGEIEEQSQDLGGAWLRVTVELEKNDPDIARIVRKLLPMAVSIGAEIPKSEVASVVEEGAIDAAGQYRQYHLEAHSKPASEELITVFHELRESQEEAG